MNREQETLNEVYAAMVQLDGCYPADLKKYDTKLWAALHRVRDAIPRLAELLNEKQTMAALGEYLDNGHENRDGGILGMPAPGVKLLGPSSAAEIHGNTYTPPPALENMRPAEPLTVLKFD